MSGCSGCSCVRLIVCLDVSVCLSVCLYICLSVSSCPSLLAPLSLSSSATCTSQGTESCKTFAGTLQHQNAHHNPRLSFMKLECNPIQHMKFVATVKAISRLLPLSGNFASVVKMYRTHSPTWKCLYCFRYTAVHQTGQASLTAQRAVLERQALPF